MRVLFTQIIENQMKGDYKAKEHYLKNEFENAKFILIQLKIFLLSLLIAFGVMQNIKKASL